MQDKQFLLGLTQLAAPGISQSTIVPVQDFFGASKQHLQALLAGAASEMTQPPKSLPSLSMPSTYLQAHPEID